MAQLRALASRPSESSPITIVIVVTICGRPALRCWGIPRMKCGCAGKRNVSQKTLMLFANKLLPIFALPLGLVVLLLIYALLNKKRGPIFIALMLLYVSSLPFTGSFLMRQLESQYMPVALAEVEKADGIVALGGIFGPATAPGYLPNLGESSERLEAGILLWQQKKAHWLVFTGGRLPWYNQAEIEGEQSKRLAVARGIPKDQILVTREVGNTVDESHAVADLMRERAWKKVILVTSACHMPRAARLFRKAGVDFIPFPVDYQVDTNAPHTIIDFLPTAEGLKRSEGALRELYGIAFYALTGR